ncbi:hypothetical protein EJ06DRAFT_543298 [Trichodelitschia bisporula]|uniref:Luciferase domain-containing protein n=1 Tax=Trichodelitschia bisporula TaxID=703511 RepID=A0A6G1HVJ1_9PEZI|nr:hypothetical protein EJ06DRAFT_543298 [Trichodelitschia bisporula]
MAAILDPILARPVVTGLSAAVGLGVLWTLRDYQQWKAFGTGGFKPDPSGYWRMTKLRLHALLHRPDPYDVSALPTTGPTYITALPERTGPRPTLVSRPMPQRQVPAPLDDKTKETLHGLVYEFAAKYPDMLEVRPSGSEGGTAEGLYVRSDWRGVNPVTKHPILKTEVAHVHPSDDSLHVWLSERDAKEVIELGWGEKFPLGIVPGGWIMVYAPRNWMEMDVVRWIVEAGVGWLTGVDLNRK